MSVQRVYLDLTHVGRHVTGLERIAIEQFEKVEFAGCEIVPVRAKGAVSMVLRQQFLLPLLALLNPSARFVFPGFPPSPVFGLLSSRVTMYVHDTFLITRKKDLSAKARLYMAPQFSFALRRLKRFLVNSEKTLAEVREVCSADATVTLYRPAVSNVFALQAIDRGNRLPTPRPLRLAALGTIEPRKNYTAAIAILDELRALGHAGAELHIVGRAGWGEDAGRIASHPGVTVNGYLPAADVKACLEAADVYLCTSHDEGLGLPLLEAQYAGLPVVAPDAPVFREVLGASGTFIDTSKPKAAAAAIAALMQPAGWRTRETEAALDNVARWNAGAAHDLAAAKRMFSPGTQHAAPSARMASHAP
jgi:glycosyltransferase involved in cell wall biosynthesis